MHAEGEFVIGHPRGELIVVGVAGLVSAIELHQDIEIGALMLAGFPSGRMDVENRRPFGAQRRALVVGGEKPVGPIAGAALREASFRQNDVSGKILILAAEPVGHPRPDGRVAAELVAGVDVVKRRRMVYRLGLATFINT